MIFYLRDVPPEQWLATSSQEQYFLDSSSTQAPRDGRFHTPTEIIDGHWLVWLIPYQNSAGYREPRVIAVIHKLEDIPTKTYEAARKYAEMRARISGHPFIDQTERGKESKLATKKA